MGSKNRYAKEILPIILKDRYDGQWYVEPFAGGFNVIDKVKGNRMANDSNYYVAGLDPTFLYRADPNLYQRFEEITLGQVNKNLAWEIENSFQAQYIFVEILGHEALVKNLLADPNIKLIYQDKEAKIFKIK